jgi:acyl carrier protein
MAIVLPSTALVPPTPTETLVAAVWCELLQLDAVSLDDNFFEVGGHSLAAVQVVQELAARMGVELDLETFFDLETLQQVAAELDRRRPVSQGEDVQLFEGEL